MLEIGGFEVLIGYWCSIGRVQLSQGVNSNQTRVKIDQPQLDCNHVNSKILQHAQKSIQHDLILSNNSLL